MSSNTLAATGTTGTRKAYRAVMRAWSSWLRALMRRVTGQSELSRILKRSGGYTTELVQDIARSIARSSEKEVVFGKQLFDVVAVSDSLSSSKEIDDEDKPRLVWCLEVRGVMVIVSCLVAKRMLMQCRKPGDADCCWLWQPVHSSAPTPARLKPPPSWFPSPVALTYS